ncbi:MAG: thioesterase family protein [Pseudomonadota bacterium]
MVRTLGIDQAAMRADGFVFAVTRIEADYLKPAKFDDALIVETRLASAGKVRCEMAQEVLRDGVPLFRADVTLACLDVSGRPRRLPAALADVVP